MALGFMYYWAVSNVCDMMEQGKKCWCAISRSLSLRGKWQDGHKHLHKDIPSEGVPLKLSPFLQLSAAPPLKWLMSTLWFSWPPQTYHFGEALSSNTYLAVCRWAYMMLVFKKLALLSKMCFRDENVERTRWLTGYHSFNKITGIYNIHPCRPLGVEFAWV